MEHTIAAFDPIKFKQDTRAQRELAGVRGFRAPCRMLVGAALA